MRRAIACISACKKSPTDTLGWLDLFKMRQRIGQEGACSYAWPGSFEIEGMVGGSIGRQIKPS
jgi:hypothetical protein